MSADVFDACQIPLVVRPYCFCLCQRMVFGLVFGCLLFFILLVICCLVWCTNGCGVHLMCVFSVSVLMYGSRFSLVCQSQVLCVCVCVCVCVLAHRFPAMLFRFCMAFGCLSIYLCCYLLSR